MLVFIPIYVLLVISMPKSTKFNSRYPSHLSFFLDQYLYSATKFPIFQFSYPLDFNHFCFLVPKGQVLNNIWVMTRAFTISLLICIPIFFFLSGIYWYYIVRGTPHQKSIFDIYFLLFGMVLDQTSIHSLCHIIIPSNFAEETKTLASTVWKF